jgi:hypothetical protein
MICERCFRRFEDGYQCPSCESYDVREESLFEVNGEILDRDEVLAYYNGEEKGQDGLLLKQFVHGWSNSSFWSGSVEVAYYEQI